MSLVNQMLKDLEARRAQLPQGDSLRGLSAAPASAPRHGRWPLIMLLCVASGGAFGWWLSLPAESPAPFMAPMAQAGAGHTLREQPAIAPAPMLADASATVAAPAIDTAETDTDDAPPVVLAALETPEPATPPQPEPKPVAPPKDNTPAPRPQPVTALASAAAREPAAGSMHKTARPLDPQQQAARHYADALTALRSGDTATAETTLRDALEIVPGHSESAKTLATLLVQQGRHGEAETVLSEALAGDANRPALRALYARLLAERGDDPAAIAQLHGVGDPEALALLGALQQRQGNHDAAAAAYRQALQSAPRRGAWWLGLAISLEQSRQPGAALEAYRRALADTGLDAQVNDYVRGRIAALGNGQG